MALRSKNLRIRKLSFPAARAATQVGKWVRKKLTEADLNNLAQRMQEKYSWNSNPKDFQLAGIQAQLEGVDTIIQAATGSGKTAIAARPYLWIQGKQSIMVCPLMTLEDEMVCLLVSTGSF